MSNPAKIFCSPGPAIKTNQRRPEPLRGRDGRAADQEIRAGTYRGQEVRENLISDGSAEFTMPMDPGWHARDLRAVRFF